MSESLLQTWNACGYVRLSREDGDKEESNSVTGQKDLIRDFFRSHSELCECGMKVDDGYTGSNFQRPAFQELISDMKAGKYRLIVRTAYGSGSRINKSRREGEYENIVVVA